MSRPTPNDPGARTPPRVGPPGYGLSPEVESLLREASRPVEVEPPAGARARLLDAYDRLGAERAHPSGLSRLRIAAAAAAIAAAAVLVIGVAVRPRVTTPGVADGLAGRTVRVVDDPRLPLASGPDRLALSFGVPPGLDGP